SRLCVGLSPAARGSHQHKLLSRAFFGGQSQHMANRYHLPLPDSLEEGEMNRSRKLALALAVLAPLIPALAQTTGTNGKREKPSQEAASSAQATRGQQVFEQNCSRCHNAPQNIPPQISATVIRHMRVRASLSAADEKALLRFMNP